jgi:hypothetical protein
VNSNLNHPEGLPEEEMPPEEMGGSSGTDISDVPISELNF